MPVVELSRICPMMPVDKRVRLAEAADKYRLTEQEFSKGITEKVVFDRKYDEIKTLYMSAVGGANPMNMKAVLDMFNEYAPLVETVISYFVHKEVNGALACDVAESNKDVVMRNLCEDTWGLTTASSLKIGPYRRAVATGTAVDLIPSTAAVADGHAATWTATSEQQTLLIMGYGEFHAGVAPGSADPPLISRVQETLSDRVNDRQPLEVYFAQVSDLKIMKRSSALWVEDDSTIDINVEAIANGVTGFYPIGIDLCTTAQVTTA